MLNVFTLTEAINGSIGHANVGHIEAYPFYGSVTEAAAEFNYQLMLEAADIAGFAAVSDEIMVEAALMNQDAIGTLTESVFSTMKEKITKFFDKLIAMAKGLRDRIKAFFFKLTGKTDKWLSVMRPRIEAAKRNSGITNVEAEMHEWNVEFVTKGFLNAYKDVVANYLNSTSAAKALDVSDIEKYLKALNTNIKTYDGVDPDSQRAKDGLTPNEMFTKSYEKDLKDAKEGFPAYLAGKFGVSANSSMEAMWQDVVKKAKGGEKKTVKYRNMVDDMVKALEDNKTGLKEMEKTYNDHIKDLADKRKEIEDTFRKFEISENKAPNEIVNSIKTHMNAYVNRTTSLYTMVEGAGSTACGMNTRFMKEMASEFMSVLTKFAGTKEKKTT